MENIVYILILLSSAVIIISICYHLKLPPIVGYLLTGVLIGPGGLRWLPSMHEMHIIAEFGVVFLMFTLGLDFSITRLVATKNNSIILGCAQVLGCIIIGYIVAYFSGIATKQSFLIACALSLSSTAVVSKQLIEQKIQHTNYGQLCINILLFQDMAAMLFLILIAALNTGNQNQLYLSFSLMLVKGMGTIACVVILGRCILRPMFREVAKAHSTELFMIATILVAISAGWITYRLGLSMALGAFLAGLILGETEFKHQIALDIRPFRDVLLGLFFILLGSYFKLTAFFTIWHTVFIILILLIAIKAFVITIIFKCIKKYTVDVALRIGIILAHGGEFTFIILNEALGKNIVHLPYQEAIFSSIIISIIITPILIRFNGPIIHWLLNLFKETVPQNQYLEFSQNISTHAAKLKNHVILCGFGRVGQTLARFLDKEDFSWVALDLDPIKVADSSLAGECCFFGDSTNNDILLAAGIIKAKALVITFANEYSAFKILSNTRSAGLTLPIFVRTRDDANLEKLYNAGATEIVPETLEGSIMLASHLLIGLGISARKILALIRNIHAERYHFLSGVFTGVEDVNILENPESRRSLHSIAVLDNPNIINKPISYLLEGLEGVVVKYLHRNTKRYFDPEVDLLIKSDDVLVIFATPEETFAIERKLEFG